MNLSLDALDTRIASALAHWGHRLHRLSLGVIFLWFGALKPLGHETATSLLAHTVYWGDPATVAVLLGWWEVTIGLCLLIRPLVRVALVLLLIRIPGILLAFILLPEITFEAFPLAPTPEGQYLLKDLAIFFAALAIGATVREESTGDVRQ